MPEDLRMTTAVAKVAATLLADPTADRYGLDLIRATGLPSGTLYPLLERLQRAGWVEAHWEDIDPVAAGRPARRYYRLTAEGVTAARSELAALYQQLGVAQQPTSRPRPA
jgi:PadR family transcriptional regulator, regulatory protein PadR